MAERKSSFATSTKNVDVEVVDVLDTSDEDRDFQSATLISKSNSTARRSESGSSSAGYSNINRNSISSNNSNNNSNRDKKGSAAASAGAVGDVINIDDCDIDDGNPALRGTNTIIIKDDDDDGYDYIDKEFVDNTNSRIVLVYPMEENEMDCVSIRDTDIIRLDQSKYLNDTLIDFGIRRLTHNILI